VQEDPFDRLLDAMPKMAEAVNAFGSPEVQRRAFDALLATLAATVNEPEAVQNPPADAAGTSGTEETADESLKDSGNGNGESKGNGRRGRARGPKKVWSANKNINWMPKDKISLRDFVEEKQPSTNYERNVVIGYYLTEHLGRETFDVADVLGGYKAAGWKFPGDPGNSLQVTASTRHWLDTADMAKIKILHMGVNAVEHELPRPKK
jgi:hypothetical protein